MKCSVAALILAKYEWNCFLTLSAGATAGNEWWTRRTRIGLALVQLLACNYPSTYVSSRLSGKREHLQNYFENDAVKRSELRNIGKFEWWSHDVLHVHCDAMWYSHIRCTPWHGYDDHFGASVIDPHVSVAHYRAWVLIDIWKRKFNACDISDKC